VEYLSLICNSYLLLSFRKNDSLALEYNSGFEDLL